MNKRITAMLFATLTLVMMGCTSALAVNENFSFFSMTKNNESSTKRKNRKMDTEGKAYLTVSTFPNTVTKREVRFVVKTLDGREATSSVNVRGTGRYNNMYYYSGLGYKNWEYRLHGKVTSGSWGKVDKTTGKWCS